ncbi:MAG: hypothetical protein RLO12_12845 [Fulvivirga sp.]
MIKIRLEGYSETVKSKIFNDLTALKVIMDLDNEDPRFKEEQAFTCGFYHFESPPPNLENLKQREVLKCFKSIIGSLQDYLDELITTVEIFKKDLKTEYKINSDEELIHCCPVNFYND